MVCSHAQFVPEQLGTDAVLFFGYLRRPFGDGGQPKRGRVSGIISIAFRIQAVRLFLMSFPYRIRLAAK